MRRLDGATLFSGASFALAACGLGALASTWILNPIFVAAAGAALVASILLHVHARQVTLPAGLWTGLTLFFVAFAVADALLLSGNMILALAHFLLYLYVHKLFTLRTDRDWYFLYGVSFFALVVASVLTIHFVYAIFFVLFQVAAIVTLILFHFKRELERPAVEGPRGMDALARLRDLPLGWSVLGSVFLTVVMTAAIFFVVPRLAGGVLRIGITSPLLMSGFSDQVELGAFGTIVRDPRVALRIRPSGVPLARLLTTTIRWRGVTFNQYDGKAWQRTTGTFARMVQEPGGTFVFADDFWPRLRKGGWVPAVDRTDLLVQEIHQEDLGIGILFGAGRPVGFAGPFRTLSTDEAHSVFVPFAWSDRQRYTVYSEIARPVRDALRAVPPRPPDGGPSAYPAEIAATYLQLPADLDPQVRALAHEIVRGALTPYDLAARLENHLATRYEYTLDLWRVERLNPLSEFLFEKKRGHCEYFATALAVMLRTVGIPSRLVTGFVRGEWNEFGQYFIVRQEDAHAWVEAYIPPMGWVAFDPSPRPPYAPRRRTVLLATIVRYLDYVRLTWNSRFVDYSLQDQMRMARNIRERTSHLRDAINRSLSVVHEGLRAGWRRLRQAPLAWGGLLAATAMGLALLVWFVARHVAPGPPTAPRVPHGRDVAFYRRALRLLARRGYSRPSAVTPAEFAQRLTAEGVPEIGSLTATYYAVRFGGHHLSPTRRTATDASLGRLAAALRARATGRAPGEGPF